MLLAWLLRSVINFVVHFQSAAHHVAVSCHNARGLQFDFQAHLVEPQKLTIFQPVSTAFIKFCSFDAECCPIFDPSHNSVITIYINGTYIKKMVEEGLPSVELFNVYFYSKFSYCLSSVHI